MKLTNVNLAGLDWHPVPGAPHVAYAIGPRGVVFRRELVAGAWSYERASMAHTLEAARALPAVLADVTGDDSARKAPVTAADVDEVELHVFATEASALGLAPGEVPRSLPTTLGNGLPFVLQSADDGAFEYRQQLGCIRLRVWND